MKTFIVKIKFMGLTGKYVSEVEVKATTPQSAEKKASKAIGNRSAWIVSVVEQK